MDVVLLKDLEKLGAEGAVVHVKPGFARNYLIPHGLAVAVTARSLKAIEETQQQRLRKAQRVKTEAEALKQKLESRSLTLKLSLGQDGKPFGAITTHDVFEALTQDGLALDKHALELEPIKALGVYDVSVRVHPDVTATVKLCVVKA